jgi:hypothetical protein
MLERVAEAVGYKLWQWQYARKLIRAQKAVGPLIDDHRIFRSLRELLAPFGTVVSRPYSQSIWIYSCINSWANNLSRVPFVLKVDAGELEPKIIEKGELYELFQEPNYLMTLD